MIIRNHLVEIQKEITMNDKQNDDKSTWAIGGGVIAGVGAGLFFLSHSALFFVGCIMLGLGLGLIITSILSNSNK